jgi:hypothetical protein
VLPTLAVGSRWELAIPGDSSDVRRGVTAAIGDRITLAEQIAANLLHDGGESGGVRAASGL